ncbi:MAG: S16 family serine protease [Candidatus Micrarchaeaceae archaeon]
MHAFRPYSIYVALIVMLVVGSAAANASTVGSAYIHAPAVILQNNTGELTVINLTVTTGNGAVSIRGPAIVAQSTLNSSEVAAMVASNYLHMNENDYNFDYYIANATNVSGPSAGTAMTLLAISALSNKPLLNNFTVTGTMSDNGTIGEIGGVYDKVSAAALDRMKFVLVPAVANQSGEAELYFLIEKTFGLPLVQVSNISEAAHFAFTSVPDIGAYETNYSFYTDYNVSRIPAASVACSNNCSIGNFNKLIAFTFKMTNSEINALRQYPNFIGAAQQLSAQLNESEAMSGKGYLYLGADQAFLTYINAYYLAHHLSTKPEGIDTINSIGNYCASVSPAAINSNNYEYVLGGELRQLWGAYTISADAAAYNLTAVDSDGVMNDLYTAGEANAWCMSSQEMYGIANNISGSPSSFKASLKNVALGRLDGISSIGANLYSQTAGQAYSDGNYPLAILDASYAEAIYGPGVESNSSLGTSALESMAMKISSNATFGIWATQFANEAQFYAYEAKLSQNSSAAHAFAYQAYETAVLAEQISNDTNVIASSIVFNTTTTTLPVGVTTVPQRPITTTSNSIVISGTTVAFIIFSVVILLVAVLIVLLIVLYVLISISKRLREVSRGKGGSPGNEGARENSHVEQAESKRTKRVAAKRK